MIGLVLFIIICILFLIILIYLVIKSIQNEKSGPKNQCTTNNDCKQGQKCINNPETKTNICINKDTDFCKITPATSLKICDPNDKDSCSQCLNQPKFSCVVVSDEKPYKWSQNGKIIYIPNSEENKGWCLPEIDKNVICNTFTSETALIQNENGYYWGCICKYPDLFTNSSPGENCNVLQGCNYDQGLGKLYVPTAIDKECTLDSDCGGENKCLLKKGICKDSTGTQKYCHTDWLSSQNLNPFTGQCVCSKDNLAYECRSLGGDSYLVSCVENTCDPGQLEITNCPIFDGTARTKCCTCPSGYVRCPEDTVPNLTNQCLTQPACYPDPCKPGYFDPVSKVCRCPGTYANTENVNSPVGWTCVDVCQGNGPCGNRGTCVLAPDKKSSICTNCKCPYNQANASDPSSDPTCIQLNPVKNILNGDNCHHDSECCSGDCHQPFGVTYSICN